jgi:hypothetical protein
MKISEEPGLVSPVFQNGKNFEKFILSKFSKEFSSKNLGLYICLSIGLKGSPKDIQVMVSPDTAIYLPLANRIKKYIQKYCRWSPAYRIRQGKKEFLPYNDCFMIKEVVSGKNITVTI